MFEKAFEGERALLWNSICALRGTEGTCFQFQILRLVFIFALKSSSTCHSWDFLSGGSNRGHKFLEQAWLPSCYVQIRKGAPLPFSHKSVCITVRTVYNILIKVKITETFQVVYVIMWSSVLRQIQTKFPLAPCYYLVSVSLSDSCLLFLSAVYNPASKKPAPCRGVVTSCSEQKPLASSGLPEFVGALTRSRSVMRPKG